MLLILEPGSWPIKKSVGIFYSDSTCSFPFICWLRAKCSNHRFGLCNWMICREVVKSSLIITYQYCWTLNKTKSMEPCTQQDSLQPAPVPLCGCELFFQHRLYVTRIQRTLHKNPQNCKDSSSFWIDTDNKSVRWMTTRIDSMKTFFFCHWAHEWNHTVCNN